MAKKSKLRKPVHGFSNRFTINHMAIKCENCQHFLPHRTSKKPRQHAKTKDGKCDKTNNFHKVYKNYKCHHFKPRYNSNNHMALKFLLD